MQRSVDHDRALNRWHALVIFLLPIAAVLFIFRDILFRDRIFFNGDAYLFFYQSFKLFARSSVLVNPWLLSGFPSYTAADASWFYPVYAPLLKVLGVFQTYHLLTLVNVILAYIGTYVYARMLKISHLPSVIAASVFTFSAQLMMWATVIVNTNYYWILPFALCGIEQLRKGKQRIWYTLGIGSVLGIGWLSGHVQFIVYIHSCILIYYLWFCVKPLWATDRRTALAALVRLFCIFGISALVGWSQIGATLSFNSQTARAHGVSLSEVFVGGYMPQDLIQYVVPFWQIPVLPASAPNLYIGIAPFVLLVFATLKYKELQPTARFYVILFFVSLGAGIYYSPLGLLIQYVPLVNSFRELNRLMFIGDFAAAIVVGFALERLITAEFSSDLEKLTVLFRKLALWFLLPIISICTVVRLCFTDTLQHIVTDFFFKYRYAQTAHLDPEHYRALIDQYVYRTLDAFSLTNIQILLCVIFVAATLFLLTSRSRMPQKQWLTIFAIIVVMNSAAVYASYYVTVPRALAESEPASVAAIKNAHASDTPFRIFSLFAGIAEYDRLVVACPASSPEDHLALEQALVVPNLNIQYGLESADGYENFMPARIAELLGYAGSERATVGSLLSAEHIPIADRVQEFIKRADILRLMNVQYILSPYQIADAGFQELYHESLPNCEGDVYVYALSNAVPRYFFTDQVSTASFSNDTIDSIARQLSTAVHDHILLLESGTVTTPSTQSGGVFKELTPQISGDRRAFVVDASQQGYLSVGEAWLPGWHATVDGNPVAIMRANYIYMAVPISRGQHTVIFSYKP